MYKNNYNEIRVVKERNISNVCSVRASEIERAQPLFLSPLFSPVSTNIVTELTEHCPEETEH